jgi:hypothetical protein
MHLLRKQKIFWRVLPKNFLVQSLLVTHSGFSCDVQMHLLPRQRENSPAVHLVFVVQSESSLQSMIILPDAGLQNSHLPASQSGA